MGRARWRRARWHLVPVALASALGAAACGSPPSTLGVSGPPSSTESGFSQPGARWFARPGEPARGASGGDAAVISAAPAPPGTAVDARRRLGADSPFVADVRRVSQTTLPFIAATASPNGDYVGVSFGDPRGLVLEVSMWTLTQPASPVVVDRATFDRNYSVDPGGNEILLDTANAPSRVGAFVARPDGKMFGVVSGRGGPGATEAPIPVDEARELASKLAATPISEG